MKEFPHSPPQGYSYEFEELRRNYTSIWIRNHAKFDYNGGVSVRSIWGFYNSRTKTYYSPINSKTVGNKVNIESTSVYSAIIPKLTPLQAAFV
jgi:hypothetical protein